MALSKALEDRRLPAAAAAHAQEEKRLRHERPVKLPAAEGTRVGHPHVDQPLPRPVAEGHPPGEVPVFRSMAVSRE